MEEVLDSCRYVAERSEHVRIDTRSANRFCEELLHDGIHVPLWDPRYHYRDNTERTVAYLLILDSLNFCFWPPPGRPRWHIEHKGEILSGYIALAASLKKAMERGIPLTNADFLSALSFKELEGILGGRGCLQLVESRAFILNELGRLLAKEYEGSAGRLVKSSAKSAVDLARLLAKKLPSFDDTAEYREERVVFYKRAQILTADLWGAFRGDSWGKFNDMHNITAFADYKLPQVLRHVGILQYSRQLGHMVDSGRILEPGSQEEIEIRANTITAVEWIRRKLEQLGESLMAFQIDWMLWNLGQKKAYRKKPYHRTVTVFY